MRRGSLAAATGWAFWTTLSPPQHEIPEVPHGDGAVGEERLVELALVEGAALTQLALEPVDLRAAEEVLAELGRVELGAEQLALRLRLLLETVVDHEAQRVLVAHLAALEPDVEDGVRGHDHPAEQVEEEQPVVLLPAEPELHEEGRAVDGPALRERAAPQRRPERAPLAAGPPGLGVMAGQRLVRGGERDLVVVVRAQVALDLLLRPGGIGRLDVVRAAEPGAAVERA